MRDFFGIFASLICIIHCLSTPVLLGAFVWFGHGDHHHHAHTLADERIFHAVMLAIVVVISLWSFPKAYKQHEKPLPTVLAILGAASLLVGLFLPLFEQTLITLVGCTGLVVAHVMNRAALNRASGDAAATACSC